MPNSIFVRKIKKKMIIRIQKSTKPTELSKLLKDLKPKPKNLQNFAGALKRGIDGVTYQKEMRNE